LPCSTTNDKAKDEQTQIKNTNRKRTRQREVLLPIDGRISPRAEPSIASSLGRARSGWSAATSGRCAGSRKRPPTLASSPSVSAGFRPMRSRSAQRSSGSFGGVLVTVDIGTPPLSSSWFAVSHHAVARARPRRGGRAAKQAPYYGDNNAD